VVTLATASVKSKQEGLTCRSRRDGLFGDESFQIIDCIDTDNYMQLMESIDIHSINFLCVFSEIELTC